jgi:hypothetical protein
LFIYELANWEVVFNGEDIQRRSTMIENAPEWLMRLFQRLQKAEADVPLLAAATADKDAMDIDIGEMRTNYQLLSDNAASLLRNFLINVLTKCLHRRTFQRNCQQLPGV